MTHFTHLTADIAVKQEASAVEEVEMIEQPYAGEADDYDQMVTAAPAMMAQQQRRQQQQGNGGEEIEEEEDEEYRELREGPRINTFLVMSEDNCVHEVRLISVGTLGRSGIIFGLGLWTGFMVDTAILLFFGNKTYTLHSFIYSIF